MVVIQTRKIGILTSYSYIFLNAISNILLTPFLISSLGIDGFGLYQLVFSFVNLFVAMNFGTGVVTTKYISEYRIEDNQKSIQNFLFFMLMLSFFAATVIFILGLIFIDILPLFGGLRDDEISLAQNVFIILIVNLSLIVIISMFEGLTLGYEKYSFNNIIKGIRLLIRLILIVLFLQLGYGLITIAVIELILTISVLIIYIIYSFVTLKVKIKFYGIDRKLIKSIMIFSLALFIQSIVGQVNINSGKVLLGIFTSTTAVGIYTIAMNIFYLLNLLSNSIYKFYVPEAVRLVYKKVSSGSLTDFVVIPGRYILMFIGAIYTAFILFGKDFIVLWVGGEYLEAWIIAIILMTASIIPLVQNICISLLNAMNKRMFRSFVLIFITLINIVFSIYLIDKIGFIGVAVATASSLIIGDIIIMNIYYKKVIGLQIRLMLKSIFKGIFPSLLITLIIFLPINLLLQEITWLIFIVKGSLFVTLYGSILWKIALRRKEKDLILNSYNRLFHIKK